MNATEQKVRLIKEITPLVMEKGLKSLTMDSVAKSLGISKRTLYEIFDSKDEMVRAALRHLRRIHAKNIDRRVAEASNAMEIIASTLLEHQRIMRNINIAFFRDMDTYYPALRKEFEKSSEQTHDSLMRMFRAGVTQGVFRDDVDYNITSRLFMLQLESLKRIEHYFTPDVTLLDAYNAISIGTLRSIASPKGMEILDRLVDRFRAGDDTDSKDNKTT